MTLPSGLINPHRTRFNPHTHAGCDYSCFAYCYSRQNVSIHTPTQGVTYTRRWVLRMVQRFNPHTHAGCDLLAMTIVLRLLVSIHTPTQGVTGRIMFIIKTGIVSIHTPTQGVTWLICMLKALFLFQSTHPRRV